MSVYVQADVLKDVVRLFESVPEVTAHATMLALNQVSEREVVPMLRRDAEQEVNFPSGYLREPRRLGVTNKATRSKLEVTIKGRDRPTSLARFTPVRSIKATRGRPIPVSVKRGKTEMLDRAFLVELKNGNLGLAIRLPHGQEPRRAYKPVKLDSGLWLLYGPSVDQVISEIAEPTVAKNMGKFANEFNRQFGRLTRG